MSLRAQRRNLLHPAVWGLPRGFIPRNDARYERICPTAVTYRAGAHLDPRSCFDFLRHVSWYHITYPAWRTISLSASRARPAVVRYPPIIIPLAPERRAMP